MDTLLDGYNVRAKDFVAYRGMAKLRDGQDICDIGRKGVPAVGFCYLGWKKGYKNPDIVYPVFTFMIKEEGEFVWSPYDEAELMNILGL